MPTYIFIQQNHLQESVSDAWDIEEPLTPITVSMSKVYLYNHGMSYFSIPASRSHAYVEQTNQIQVLQYRVIF